MYLITFVKTLLLRRHYSTSTSAQEDLLRFSTALGTHSGKTHRNKTHVDHQTLISRLFVDILVSEKVVLGHPGGMLHNTPRREAM